ncbi:MAG: hypothetical protein KKC51_08720, partial [Verrucomicrobia bacterium]|nr:hypothetical protein [Verrucomicrobiota bacterium]
ETDGPYSAFRTTSGRPPAHSRQAMVVRHYRYRSPRQVQRRFAARSASKTGAVKRFRYELSGDFSKLIRPLRLCRVWPDPSCELAVPRWEIARARLRMRLTLFSRKIERMLARIRRADGP